MSTYSYSQISTFTTCPRRYQYHYVEGLGKTTREDSLVLTLGNVFHETLEWLYRQKSNTIVPTLDQLMEQYHELWSQHLSQYTEPPVESELSMFTLRGVEYLQWYYEMYAPFDVRVMGIEDWISVKLDDQINFRGKIDRLDAQGDTIVITDYKTSRRLPQDYDDSNREQLVLYAHGVKHSYGRKFSQIQGLLIYPHLHKEYRFEIDDEEIGLVVGKYLTIMRDIETRKSKHDTLFADGVDQFPPIAGNHCQWCPFMQICPKWKHQFTDEEIVSSELGEQTITSLVTQYIMINEQSKALEKEKKYLSKLVSQRLEAKDITKRDTEVGTVGYQTRDFYSIPPTATEDLKQYLSNHGLLDQTLKLDTHAITSLINQDQLDISQLDGLVTKSTSSWIMSKKKNE